MMYTVILFWFFTLNYYTDPSWLGVSYGTPWWHLLTYSFIHTNILHLAMNAAMHVYYWQFLRQLPMWRVLTAIIPAVILSAWLAREQMVTIGASAVVFAEIGIVLNHIRTRRGIIRAVVLLSIVFTLTWLFAENVNTAIHVYALLIAYAVYYLTGEIKLKLYRYEKE